MGEGLKDGPPHGDGAGDALFHGQTAALESDDVGRLSLVHPQQRPGDDAEVSELVLTLVTEGADVSHSRPDAWVNKPPITTADDNLATATTASASNQALH